jgi:hypothetical protein
MKKKNISSWNIRNISLPQALDNGSLNYGYALRHIKNQSRKLEQLSVYLLDVIDENLIRPKHALNLFTLAIIITIGLIWYQMMKTFIGDDSCLLG